MVAAALIGAGASLLGGIFSRNSAKKATARQNEYNKPINIRARAEEGGFNPLLWAGQGNVQMQPTASGQFGNAIANAGLYAADSMKDKQALDIEKSRLKMDREKLDNLLQKNTIRPKSGGIYSGTTKTPSAGGVGSPVKITNPNVGDTSDTVPEARHVNETVKTSSGEDITTPLGPDLDEWLTGVVIETAGGVKKAYKSVRDDGLFSSIKTLGDTIDKKVLDEGELWWPKDKNYKKPAKAKRGQAQRDFMKKNFPTPFD